MADPASTIPARRTMSYALRIVNTGFFWLTILLQIGLIAGMWWLYHWAKPWLSTHRNYDPYAFMSMAVGGSTPTAFEQRLPDGRTIRIDNRGAMFVADVDSGDRQSERLFGSFHEAIEHARREGLPLLPSASMIHHTFKREDDALLEEVQLGVNRLCVELLEDLDAALAEREDRPAAEARAFVAAALVLADRREEAVFPDAVARQARQLISEFRSGARSAGRGFNESTVAPRYARSEELARMFTTQRFLTGLLEPPAAEVLLELLEERPDLRERLAQINAVYDVLDNPAETAHLLRPDGPLPQAGVHFLPAARSPENEHYYATFGAGPPPDELQWLCELTESVRSGRLDLTPRSDSGWYDHKLYALAPLVRRDHAIELLTNKLRATELYRAFMAETFRAALVSTRESHIMRIQPIYMGILPEQEPELPLGPQFGCEPTPIVYWRLALAYDYLREQLPAEFGMHEQLAVQAERARGLAALALLELGIPADFAIGEPLPDGFPHAGLEATRDWLAALPDSPPMREDPRFCLPVMAQRQWGIVGVRLRRLKYEYDVAPWVEGYQLKPTPSAYWAPVLVATEFRRPIAPDKFPSFCSRFDRVGDCLTALTADSANINDGRIPWPAILWPLTLGGLAHTGWRIHRRRRPAPPKRLSIWKKLQLAVCVVLLIGLFFLVGPAWFGLHILPRLDLPRWHARWWSELPVTLHERIQYRLKYDNNLEFPLYAKVSFGITDWLLARALNSESQPVRENALNICWLTWTAGERSYQALLDVGRSGSYDEVEMAMDALGSYAIDDDPHDASRRLDNLRPILERFGNDPRIVIKSANLVAMAGGPPADVAMIEKAVRDYPLDDMDFKRAINALMCGSPKTLPYDRLVELGYFPADPADARLGDPRLAVVLDALSWHLGRWDIKSDDPAKYDPRLAQITLNLQLCEDWLVASCAASIIYNLATTEQVRYAEMAAQWLIEDPTAPDRPHHVDHLLEKLCYMGSGSKYDFPDPEERQAVLATLERIRDSGRWNERQARNMFFLEFPRDENEPVEWEEGDDEFSFMMKKHPILDWVTWGENLAHAISPDDDD